MGSSNLYVGAARWTAGTLGGVFRLQGERWEKLGGGLPEDVHVQAITVHPQERGVVFVGAGDGVYRSRDAGATWARLPTPAGVQVWSVTVHPQQPNVILAGTSPVGMLRSDDSGDTWRQLPGPRSAEQVKMSFACRVMRIAVDPGHGDQIYVALEVGGAMRSLDGGLSWTDCAPDLARLAQAHPKLRSRLQSDTENEGMLDAHALCVSASAPDNVFIAVRMGVFQSRDQGLTWQDLEVGRFSPLTYARDIRISPHDSKVLFACLSPASQSRDGSICRSDDLGATWRRIDHGVKSDRTMMAIALDPNDPNGIHGVSRCGQIFSTRDGGKRWVETRLPAGTEDVYAIACG